MCIRDIIYVLLIEVLDNSIDEYMMGYGKTIEVTILFQNTEVWLLRFKGFVFDKKGVVLRLLR